MKGKIEKLLTYLCFLRQYSGLLRATKLWSNTNDSKKQANRKHKKAEYTAPFGNSFGVFIYCDK